MKIIIVVVCLLFGTSMALSQDWDQTFPMINDTPVIGILTLPPEEETSEYKSYFQANYVKYLEMAGARVIPIMYDDSKMQMQETLRYLNGVLLTGGGTDIGVSETNLLTPYGEAVQTILKHSQVEMNSGRYFPVWGTCLGYEAISVVLTNNTKSLGKSNARYVSLKLTLTQASKNSRLFKNLDQKLAIAVSQNSLTYHEHEDGVPLSYYNDIELGLNKQFNVLGTAIDMDEIPIVAAIEHKTLPIYGVAFHPEKTIFDFVPGYNIPHENEAEDFARYLAQFFVSETRRSQIAVNVEDVLKLKIENYPLIILDTYMGEEYRFN